MKLFRGTALAFTLAELLIALAILGVIATFTIPKVLQSQTDKKYTAMAKEAMSLFSGAYDAYRQQNTLSGNTKLSDVLSYVNYVSLSTIGNVNYPNGGVALCSAANKVCMQLHNGSVIRYDTVASFGGTGTTNAIPFYFDPSGQQDNIASLQIFLYYNGRIATAATILPATCATLGCFNPGDYPDPPWFSWN